MNHNKFNIGKILDPIVIFFWKPVTLIILFLTAWFLTTPFLNYLIKGEMTTKIRFFGTVSVPRLFEGPKDADRFWSVLLFSLILMATCYLVNAIQMGVFAQGVKKVGGSTNTENEYEEEKNPERTKYMITMFFKFLFWASWYTFWILASSVFPR